MTHSVDTFSWSELKTIFTGTQSSYKYAGVMPWTHFHKRTAVSKMTRCYWKPTPQTVTGRAVVAYILLYPFTQAVVKVKIKVNVDLYSTSP